MRGMGMDLDMGIALLFWHMSRVFVDVLAL